jgi:ABC-type uncharacterized transport system permease subunit
VCCGGLTLAAIVTRLVWMNAPEKLVGAIFIGLGWTAGMAAPAVWVHGGIAPAFLLLTGGVLYTAGALSYYRRWPDPVPAVFGFHEVFHAYVCAAATCQYIAITLLILWKLERSRLGLIWKSIGMADHLAQSLGVNIATHKLLAFMVGCFFAAAARAFRMSSLALEYTSTSTGRWSIPPTACSARFRPPRAMAWRSATRP